MYYNAKHVLLTLICSLILLVFYGNAYADTLTWTGGGSNNLASNPSNWTGSIIPQLGDTIVFNNTSSKDCSWDLATDLSAIKIDNGYSGTVNLNSSLVLSKMVFWSGEGADNLASNPVNWSDNTVPQDGDRVVFNDSSSKDCTWDISIAPALFSLSSTYSGAVTLNQQLSIYGNLTVAGGMLDLHDNDLTVYGYVIIGISGALDATSATIEFKGDWANAGNFMPVTSTVILNGTNQTIYGDTTFYNLVKIVTSEDTLYFQAGSTQTIANSLTLQGESGELLSFRSTIDGQQWQIDPQGTRNISFANIKDMSNKNFDNIIPLNSVDSGNNTGASFGGSECVYVEDGLRVTEVLSGGRRKRC